ncbi:MAG: DnaJ C-terminal domain-containing protein [Xanthomonadales bacterium]|nr:DnaJ C-terminal domain-containing protein [Xanthomonadales bacterium]
MQGATQNKDFYRILGVDENADAAEIRRAYRKLARKYHPDRNKDADAEEKFKEVGEAYDVLKDEKKRAAYDQFRKGGPFHGFGNGPGGWTAEEFGFGGGNRSADFGDLFETLFGGFGRAQRGPDRARATRGENVQAELKLNLEDAYRGGTQRLQLGDSTVDVKIPAGVQDRQKIRLKGKGRPGAAGSGDLILTVRIKPHRHFTVDGRNLTTRVNVAPWEAAEGAQVPVPTLSGNIELKVPAGSRSGQKLRAKGRGLPGSPPGDLIVELMIQTPKADSERVRSLYDELRKATRFKPRD